MPVGAVAATAYGLGKTLGIDFGSILGGSSEKGSGTTQPGTLPHAIDKLDKANDFEAIEIAKKIIPVAAQGGSDRDIELIIAQQLGYSTAPGRLTNSDKWAYISETLDDAVGKYAAAKNDGGGSPTAMVPGLSGTAQAGIGWPLIIAIIGIIGSVLYYKYQP